MGDTIKNLLDYKYMKLSICGIILFVVLAVVFFFNDATRFDGVKLSGLQSKKENSNPLRKSKVVITSIQMGVGDKDSLGLVLASPYKDSRQQSQLTKYEAQIKNDFLMEVNEEKLKEWVKKRNYREIKATFRKIVNKYLDEPVPEVYLSNFFYE
jgi:flagellar basal body-associated protein FliL